jgi:UDP-glucose 4-epimerase
VTAGEIADLVEDLIPGAHIEIQPGPSDADRAELSYRGGLDVRPAREQLGYAPRFARVRDRLAEYIETYRRFVGG